MPFHSLRFVWALAAFLFIYWRGPKTARNGLLLAASLGFYAAWDWRFLPILILSAAFNYLAALTLETADARWRKTLLAAAVIVNLAVLGVFKYFGFFAGGLSELLARAGLGVHPWTLDIALPLGISFFTFQSLTYVIDVGRGTMRAEPRFDRVLLFTCFFPTIVSGPIERAKNLLPQFAAERRFDWTRFQEGLWLFSWGVYKKIVVADNVALAVAETFNDPAGNHGIEFVIGAFLAAVWIYADFSGYSDMARGAARMLGIDVMQNFKNPFFATDLFDFWRRWHVSLTTWIQEYVFYPLGLARPFGRPLSADFTLLVTWAVMGLWHGPSMKYLLWGLYHGALLVAYSRLRNPLRALSARGGGALSRLAVVTLFSAGIVCFAVPSTGALFLVIQRTFTHFWFSAGTALNVKLLLFHALLLVPVAFVEVSQYRTGREFAPLAWRTPAKVALYYGCFYALVAYGVFVAKQYFYFRF